MNREEIIALHELTVWWDQSVLNRDNYFQNSRSEEAMELILKRNEVFAEWMEKKAFLDGAVAMLEAAGCPQEEIDEELKEVRKEEDRLFIIYVKAFNRARNALEIQSK